MREIHSSVITEAVARLCIDANYYVNKDILSALSDAIKKEDEGLSKDVLNIILENAEVARTEKIPICQDTGMAVVFVDIGQEVHITGGLISDAINEGVKIGYNKGYLRKSMVSDPIIRNNTNDNTPAVIYYSMVSGESVTICVAPKGFGSENMSDVRMLTPSDGIEGIKRFVVETVKSAGSNPCPPIIVGVGVGGTMDKAALIAKQALLKEINEQNDNPFWAEVENGLLEEINALNIGPGGFGGKTTALAVKINTFGTHIASLPVAVNIGCHATRHKRLVI